MKKIYLLVAILFTFSISGFSQLLTEDFSYTAGQLITANGWAAHSGAGTNAIAVTTPGLTYTGHPGSGVGNAVTMTTSGEDDNKGFTAVTTGSTYFSFLVNVSAAQTTGDYFIGLFQTSSIFPLRIYAKADGAGGYFFGVSKGSGAVAYETVSRTFGTTYFVVGNYILNTGTTTDDVVNLWINPALGGTETASNLTSVTGADGASIAAVYLRQGSATAASTQQIDAILVGTTWASVTPSGSTSTPTLSATALTAFGNVCLNTASTANSFTITGTNLTTANVTVGALSGYTYSTTAGGTYASTLTITPTAGAVSQQVFVKLTPTAVQSYNGNIAVTGGGATAINVAATGAGVNTTATVTAGAATGITTTGATIPGTIPTTGCTTVTAYGAEYSTTTGFANGAGTQVASTNLSGTTFTAVIASGLTAGTTYYYHTFATNGGGTVYSAEQSFLTTSLTPILTATALTGFGNVCLNTASAANSFTITGSDLTAANVVVGALTGYTYSTTAGGTYASTLTITPTAGAVSQQVFVKLTPTAVQSYSGNIPVTGGGATAINVAATGAGVNTAATVTAGAATGITQTGATIPGTIPTTGCTTVTAYGAEYSTTTGFANGAGTQVASTNLSGTAFTAVIASGLTASTTYYYHTFATNGGGTVYSAEQSFMTSAPTAPPISGIVISQVYGGGGNAGATYNADYVELKNITTAPITLTGYSIQYGSAAVTGAWSGVYALPTSTIIPGGYYLIQLTAAGTVGTSLPTPDAIATPAINMSGTAGRVALVNGTTALSACPAASAYIDLVGFGTTATCFEGSAAAGAQTSTTADFRKNNGCTETNDNANDFEVLAAAPRNSATPAIVCGAASPTLSATALTAFGNVCLNTASTANSFTITGTNLTTANVTVGALSGYTYSTTAGGTYASTLTITPTAGAVSQQVFVKLTPTAVQSYSGNIAVTGGGATAINVAATGAGVNTTATVTAGAATGITTTGATIPGTIPTTGCTTVTAYGAEYSTTTGFANGAGTQVASTNLSGTTFTAVIASGLTAGTTYYYHTFATNGGGTVYSAEQSFTTAAAATPTLSATTLTAFGNVCLNTASTANSFTVTGANLTGNLTVGALSGYTYSTTAGGTYASTLTITPTAGAVSQQVFVKLTPTAVQSYSGNIPVTGGGATAINVAATGAGVNTTATVTAGAATGITQTGATIPGTIPTTGCTTVTAYGAEYSTTTGFANGAGTQVASTNLSGTAFTAVIASGLTASTTYYYHTFATNGGGTVYSAEQSFTTSSTTPPPTGGVVISQVYGGGGNTGATFNADYVELKNISAAPVTLTGYSIQYGSATVAGAWSGVFALPTATIPAGGFYLIQMSATGTVGTALPTPDAVAAPTINMSGTAGRVALVNGITALSACPAASAYVDLVGFGTTATCFEGSAAAGAQTSTTADFRKNNGCTETNDNANDFEVLTAAPRNSATTAISCTGATATLTATALTGFGNVCLNTASTANSFIITGSNLTTANVVVGALAGYTYSTTAAGTYTSTLTITPTAGAVSQQVFVKLTPTAVQSYNGNIPVTGGGATAINVAATGAGINTIATVTSGAASAITSVSATVAGSITATGCSSVTAYGIEYSTTNGFANGSGTAVISTNLSGGNFSSALGGLTASTTYYYHAYATNGGGTAYGAQLSFTTTVAVSPTLSATALASFGNVCPNTTAGPNSFTITGAVLTTANITVGPLAGYTFSTTTGGTYTPSLTLTQTGGTYSQVVYVKFSPTAVQSYNGNIAVTGGGATAINVAAIGAGVTSSATIATGAASAITQTAATLAGTIATTGCTAVTAYGIEYSTTNGFANGGGTKVPSTNLTGTNFSSAITGLTVSTTYYYHAYVTDGSGTMYGVQQSFTTSAATLTVGALTGFGNVCVNTTAGPNSFTITSNLVSAANINVAALAGYTYSTAAAGTYTSTLSLTQPGGAYSQTVYVKFTPTAVQSYSGNIAVSGGGSAGNTNVAVTGTGINTGATVATAAATNITATAATLAGTVTVAGCSTATSYGIEYSSIPGLANGLGTKVASNNLTAGGFTSTVTGLVPNSNYYYKAYSTSSAGTTYGLQDTFTTRSLNAGLIIYNNPILRGRLLAYSVDNLTNAHYTVNILNSFGQIVYSQGVIVQVGFINDKFIVPASLPSGVYVLEIRNPAGYVANKRFILL